MKIHKYIKRGKRRELETERRGERGEKIGRGGMERRARERQG